MKPKKEKQSSNTNKIRLHDTKKRENDWNKHEPENDRRWKEYSECMKQAVRKKSNLNATKGGNDRKSKGAKHKDQTNLKG